LAPGEFHVTVIEEVAIPAVIVPPEETFQVYPVMPVWVVYTFPVEFMQTEAGPEIVGTGTGFTVTAWLAVFLHEFALVTVTV
jgi:hypothetical protein